MGRPSKFSSDQILDEASRLLGSEGPLSLSISIIAERLGAPSGSIYHRYGSRDLLVAELWLRTVERFQQALAPALDIADGIDAVREVAVGVVAWSRANPLEAQLLLLHRSSDLLHNGWPPELTDRNLAQRARTQAFLDSLCQQLGATTPTAQRRVAFAAIDIPYAAVRPSLSGGTAPPDDLDDLVVDAVTGVLDKLHTSPEGTK